MSWKELESEATEDLIVYLTWINDSELSLTAQNAFQAFCFRFQADIVNKCRIICRNRGYDDHIADDLAQRAFERFLKYPNFDFEKSNAKDYDTGVKLYLYRIAANLLNDFYNEQNCKNPNPYNGDEDLVYEFPNVNILQMEQKKLKELKKTYELIQNALARLSPKHKIIYLTYQQHATKGFKMPRHLTEKLRTELQLTQATVQFYKKEAFDKVNEYLEIYASK